MKANILGTEYQIIIEPREANSKLDECNGYTDFTIKEIHVCNMHEDKNDTMALQDMDTFIKKVIRHEIIHAFLIESGLNNNSMKVEYWAQNEEMVDWIAYQFPKISMVFKEIGCL